MAGYKAVMIRYSDVCRVQGLPCAVDDALLINPRMATFDRPCLADEVVDRLTCGSCSQYAFSKSRQPLGNVPFAA